MLTEDEKGRPIQAYIKKGARITFDDIKHSEIFYHAHRTCGDLPKAIYEIIKITKKSVTLYIDSEQWADIQLPDIWPYNAKKYIKDYCGIFYVPLSWLNSLEYNQEVTNEV